MEGSGYSTLREVNCVIHWYQSWTPRQRQEFLNDLVKKALPNKVDLLLDTLGGMNMRDRPPNIFECQLRLFNQWFEEWDIHGRNFMIERLESFDPAIVEEFYERVRRGTNLT